MRAKNVSVSLYQHGGELKVWCASFTLPAPDTRMNEAAIRRKAKEIEKLLEAVEFSDDKA